MKINENETNTKTNPCKTRPSAVGRALAVMPCKLKTMKLRIKNTKLTIIIISWLQIIGGIAGIGLMIYLMLQTETLNGAILLMLLFGLSLFIFSIYSGKKLLTDKNKKAGVIYSIINQALQIIQFGFGGYKFIYSSGAEFALGIQEMGFKMNFSLIISKFEMAIKSGDVSFVKLNLFALLVLIILVDILDELKEQKGTTLNNETDI